MSGKKKSMRMFPEHDFQDVREEVYEFEKYEDISLEPGTIIDAKDLAFRYSSQCMTSHITSEEPIGSHCTSSSPIFKISEKIRMTIFSYLPVEERIKVQLVCRLFRFEIRVRVGIAGFVKESTTYGPTFMRDIICDTVVVGRYLQPQRTPLQLILRWRETKQLIFVDINAFPYMDAFVNRCSQIERLAIRNCTILERAPVPLNPQMRRDYKLWRKSELIRRSPYKLQQCTHFEIYPSRRHPCATIEMAVELCKFTGLQRLEIGLLEPMKMVEIRRIHCALYYFMQRALQLKDVFVNCSTTWKDKRVMPIKNLLRVEKEIFKSSRLVTLRELTMTEEIVNFQTWICFLYEQKNLEILRLMHLTMFPKLFQVITLNKATLTIVNIFTILEFEFTGTFKKYVYLDLAVFGLCYNLKELFISIGGPYAPGLADVTNFRRLPISLQVFGLQNATFHGKDLLNMKHLRNLKSLGIITPPCSGKSSHNLTSRHLKSLIYLRQLDELVMQGFTLNIPGVQDLYTIGAVLGSLTQGLSNTFFMRHPNVEKARWTIGGRKQMFVYRLFPYKYFDPYFI